MMNKIKILFSTILCAAVFAACVSAQGAKASSSDVSGMIEFYEWAFDTDFTPSERSEYTRLLNQGFRDDAAAERSEVDAVQEKFAKIKRGAAADRREARRVFLDKFLPTLKQGESTNPQARFLLEVYRRSHDGKDVLTTLDAASGDIFDKRALGKATNADGTPNVVGKWKRGTGSGYVSPGGKSQHRVSDEHTFEFLPDGTVEYVFESDLLNLMQCRTTETIRQSGKYSISGGALTINLAAGTSVGTSGCNKNANFKKSVPAATIEKAFSVRRLDSPYRPSQPLILCFDGQKDEGCFEKQ